MQKRILTSVLAAAILVSATASSVSAGDRSFSSLVEHLQSSYRAKRQSSFGAITFGRLLVKLIRPAGVRNFKVVMLKELDFADGPAPGAADFHSYIRGSVSKDWLPLAQFSSRRNNQYTHIYAQQTPGDVKILVVAVQQREAYVAQFKFSPEKLMAFIDNPKLMGISLKGEGDRENQPTPNAETINQEVKPPTLE